MWRAYLALSVVVSYGTYVAVVTLAIGGVRVVAPTLAAEWQFIVSMLIGVPLLIMIGTHPTLERFGQWLDRKSRKPDCLE